MIGIHRIKDFDADTFDMGKITLWGNRDSFGVESIIFLILFKF